MGTTKTALLAALLCLAGVVSAQVQAPQAPATPPASGQPGQETGSASGQGKPRLIPSFLIVGTVFNENAMSFPGVQVRIRLNGEKKFRWETYTNSRGEFAVRVPPGFEYVLVTHVKKYGDQTENVNAKVDVQQRVSIKLEPQTKGKAGAKT